jgi:starvation-inducible DNA-binding protein
MTTLPLKYQRQLELNTSNLTQEVQVSSALNPSAIPLDLSIKSQLINSCKVTVACLSDLEGQLHSSHWNIKGMTFPESHKLFDEIRDDILPFIDQIAERAVALGGVVNGTATETNSLTVLLAYPIDSLATMRDHCEFLVPNLVELVKHCRRCIEMTGSIDLITQNIYINLVEVLEKRIWFLQKHLL